MRLEPDTVIDRYRVEALLGEGGMAAVYRVRHEQLGTPFALKVLKASTPDIRDRLLQEGRVQAALRHPNIVSVTDVVLIDGVPGLVMEFVEGAALDTLLAEGRLNLLQADHLARGILAGAAAAHEEGLIHRDLKPANILLALDRRDQFVPKITDFGLAKVLDLGDTGGGVEATRQGIGFGTPAFMAPEQIRNAAGVDHRADIFSLGAILYELVTGQRCFAGTDVLTVLNRVAGAEYEPIIRYAPDLPQHMVDAIHGALCIRPDDRWPDVRSLLACWKQEESDFEMPFGLETSQRMRVLGAGRAMPPADGPTAIRHPTPSAQARQRRPASEIETADLPEPTEPPDPVPESTRSPIALLLGLGLSTAAMTALAGVVLALVVVAGIAVWWSPDPPEPPPLPIPAAPSRPAAEPVPTPVPRAGPVPTPGPRAGPVPTPVPQAGPVPTPVPQAGPVPMPRPKGPVPLPSSVPEIADPVEPPAPVAAPRYGSVFISGDAIEDAWLVAADGTRRAYGSRVVPDTYTVGAQFADGSKAVSDLRFALAPGDIVHIACNASFGTCERP